MPRGQPDAGDLAQRGVRLLGRGRVDAGADAATLRAALEGRRLGLLDLVLPALADQLLDGGHSPRLRLVLRCRGASVMVWGGCRPGRTGRCSDPRGRECRPGPTCCGRAGRTGSVVLLAAHRSCSSPSGSRNRVAQRTREGPGIPRHEGRDYPARRAQVKSARPAPATRQRRRAVRGAHGQRDGHRSTTTSPSAARPSVIQAMIVPVAQLAGAAQRPAGRLDLALGAGGQRQRDRSAGMTPRPHTAKKVTSDTMPRTMHGARLAGGPLRPGSRRTAGYAAGVRRSCSPVLRRSRSCGG